MKIKKAKEKKIFSCIEQITNKYLPSESEAKKQKKAMNENPRLLGEHFATQALKQVRL